MCCQFPGICLFSVVAVQVYAVVYMQTVFLTCTAVLTLYVYCWTTNMAIFSAVGAWRMRRAADTDWNARLKSAQESCKGSADYMHIVILPNYMEDEEMMLDTLANIGVSPSSKENIRVVLGMEAREGPRGKDKAERLIKSTGHLFKDIFAAYHPVGLPGEIAGKSPNTQWAYRAALDRYKSELAGIDPARVFLSVGDADTLWNPQYFDALAYHGLTTPPERVAWTLWQPPMLLFRNLYAVPGVTRLAGMGTLLFELAGLANQHIGTHFCFSSYSLTLALALHRDVRGWDTDVVAEDHHMYAKCFFAPLWGAVDAKDKSESLIEAKVELCPIYLPAEGYLVESSAGYTASCWARFQQARRHSQGVAELGYVLLQYLRLVRACGFFRLSWSTHRQIWMIIVKMHTVHITNSAQAFSLILAGTFAVFGLAAGLHAEGFSGLLEHGGYHLAASSFSAVEAAKWALFAIFGPAPPVAILSGATIYLVVRDVIEGYYLRKPGAPLTKAQEEQQLTLSKRVWLAVGLQLDMLLLAEPTVIVYGLVPATMACWSLLRRGMRFDYVVAAKPGDSQ